jgi:hypothetical protein
VVEAHSQRWENTETGQDRETENGGKTEKQTEKRRSKKMKAVAGCVADPLVVYNQLFVYSM